MSDFLHGFQSDHGPIFLLTENSIAPKGIKVIRMGEYFGKTDGGTAKQMSTKIQQKMKKIDEVHFTKDKKMASVADKVRSIVPKIGV